MKTVVFACAALTIALGASWCAPEAAAQTAETPAGRPPGTPAPKAPGTPAGKAPAPAAQTPGAPAGKASGTPAAKAAPKQQQDAKQQQDLEKIYRDLRGEWRRNGPVFGCEITTSHELPRSERTAEAMYFACLRMGPLAIRGEAAALKALGQPTRNLPQPKGATAQVYPLDPPFTSPYLVATVLNDRIVALQISGQAPTKGFSFNRINLGDGTATLLQHFGSPMNIGPSGRKDTDLWGYKPWTFTFEIENDRVTSIRIADPTY